MSGTGGVIKWSQSGGDVVLIHGLRINGHAFSGGQAYPRFDTRARQASAAVLETGPQHVTQHVWYGGNVPVNLNPRSFDMEFLVNHQADYEAFILAFERSRPVALYLDMLWAETFYVPGNTASGGVYSWRTARELPWDLVGITHATRMPRATQGSTGTDADQALTVITSGTPAANQIVIPQAGGYAELKTNSGQAGDWLVVWYWPEYHVVAEEIGAPYREVNGLRFSAAFREVFENPNFVTASAEVS